MSLCGKLPASPGSAVLINSSMTLSGNGSPEGEVLAQRGYNGGGGGTAGPGSQVMLPRTTDCLLATCYPMSTQGYFHLV